VAELEFTFEIDGQDVTVVADESYKDNLGALQQEALRLYQEQKRLSPDVGISDIPALYGAAGEFGLEGVTSAIGGVASYPYGAYVTATEGEQAGQAAKKSMQEAMTYEPSLEYTDIMKTKIGEFVKPAVEAVTPYVEKGLTGIQESAKGAFAPLGEAASETAGYLMRYLPQTTLEALGLYGTGAALKRGVTLKDDYGRPTKTLRAVLRKEGVEYDSLPPEAQAAIPAVVGELPFSKGQRKQIARQTAQEEIKQSSTQGGLAERMIDEGEGFSGRVKQGLLGERIVEDPFGVDAVAVEWKPSFVQMVKTTDAPTRLKMFEMLNTRRKIEVDDAQELALGRPIAVAGDVVVERYNFMRDKSIEAGRANKALIDTPEFKNAPFDTRLIDDRLDEIFDDLKIDYKRDANNNPVVSDGVPQINFKDSMIEVDPTAQRVINNLIKILSNKNPTMAEAHNLKRKIDNMVNYEQTQASLGKVTTEAENAAKKLRATVNDALRDRFPEYARNNDIMSGFMDIEGSLRKGMGKNTFARMKEGSRDASGRAARRLLTNLVSRDDLMEGLRDLSMMSEQLGGKFDVDLWKLAQFDANLDANLGEIARHGMASKMESSVKRGIGSALDRRGQIEIAAEAIDTLRKKAKGIDPSVQGKLDALERLVLRGL
jgi:hypothetical protein